MKFNWKWKFLKFILPLSVTIINQSINRFWKNFFVVKIYLSKMKKKFFFSSSLVNIVDFHSFIHSAIPSIWLMMIFFPIFFSFVFLVFWLWLCELSVFFLCVWTTKYVVFFAVVFFVVVHTIAHPCGIY